jgi:NOL1/NOP2/sun family putative RNA methylase
MGRKRRDGRGIREARARERLESYRAFIDDWDAFQEAVARPEPTTLRTNVLRISRDELAGRLTRQGFSVSELPHQPAFLRVDDGPFPVSDTLEHWAGLFYMQQSVTGWAAPLLDPRPGDRVLDLCAAPGGKTTHLAELLAGEGSLVCADVNETRIRALLGNIYRLGHTGVITVAGDGRRFPEEALFDRIMVDVPCSSEGTLRKRGGTIPGHSDKWSRQVTRAQEKLLRKAVQLVRPGGTLLYVTCTFGPEENEGILTRVLADTPLEVERLDLPVPHARGLTRHGGESFDPRLEGAVRFYPHHLDSGGLFICRLRRSEAEDAGGGSGDGLPGWRPVPGHFPEPDEALEGGEGAGSEGPGSGGAGDAKGPGDGGDTLVAAGLAFLEQEFGVDPAALAGAGWMRRGTNIWLHTVDDWPVEDWSAGDHWRSVATGLRAFDLSGNGPPRPTNDLLCWLDDRLATGRVELSAEEWLRLLEEREIPGEGKDGLVALCHDGVVLARGFQRGGLLRHEVPKGRLRWLRSVMGSRAGGSD